VELVTRIQNSFQYVNSSPSFFWTVVKFVSSSPYLPP